MAGRPTGAIFPSGRVGFCAAVLAKRCDALFTSSGLDLSWDHSLRQRNQSPKLVRHCPRNYPLLCRLLAVSLLLSRLIDTNEAITARLRISDPIGNGLKGLHAAGWHDLFLKGSTELYGRACGSDTLGRAATIAYRPVTPPPQQHGRWACRVRESDVD